MAQEDGETDRRRHKHRRRRHSDSYRGHESEYEQDSSSQAADNAFDKPPDIAALREARLKSMETPTAARKKMKLEYQYSRPVRAQSTVKAKGTKTTSSLFGKRPSVLSVRPKSTTNVPTRSGQKDGEYESVYTTEAPSVVERAFPTEDQDKKSRTNPKEPKEKRKKSTSTSAPAPEKPKADRRKTEPAPTLRRSSTTATNRPQVHRTNTAIKAPKALSTTDAPSKSAPSEPTPKPPPTRPSSVFTSLFTKPSPPPEKLVPCLTCGSDDIPLSKSAKLPCTHRMCHSCLKRIFKMSIRDPAHMPPRCCTEKHIALEHVDKLFSDEFKKTWNRKFKEYNAKNRVYCPRRGCGEWIQPKHMRIEQGRKVGVCAKCKYAVCGICNQRAHKSRECPKDPAIQELSEMAEQKGWRKCYNCKAMVELREGCNHMTCRCTAEFCMVCGRKWKGCDCPWFNYEQVGEEVRGDPVRAQMEMDRRGEMMRRDEELAREMAGLGVGGDARRERRERRHRGGDPGAGIRGGAGDLAEFADVGVGIGNAAAHHMNANFLQQAREALTANYQNAEVAARGLLGGWLTGRENPLPGGIPGDLDQQAEQLLNPAPPPGRRRTYRYRHAAPDT